MTVVFQAPKRRLWRDRCLTLMAIRHGDEGFETLPLWRGVVRYPCAFDPLEEEWRRPGENGWRQDRTLGHVCGRPSQSESE